MPRAVFVPVDGHTEPDDVVMRRGNRNADACGFPLPPYQGIYIDPDTRERVHLFTEAANLREFHQRQFRPAQLTITEREAKKRRELAVVRAAENQTALAFEGSVPDQVPKHKGEGE
jgi:hypothetical protein